MNNLNSYIYTVRGWRGKRRMTIKQCVNQHQSQFIAVFLVHISQRRFLVQLPLLSFSWRWCSQRCGSTGSETSSQHGACLPSVRDVPPTKIIQHRWYDTIRYGDFDVQWLKNWQVSNRVNRVNAQVCWGKVSFYRPSIHIIPLSALVCPKY